MVLFLIGICESVLRITNYDENVFTSHNYCIMRYKFLNIKIKSLNFLSAYNLILSLKQTELITLQLEYYISNRDFVRFRFLYSNFFNNMYASIALFFVIFV